MNKTLSKKLFSKEMDMVPTRNGYGEGLLVAGKKNKNVVVLCADLTESTRSEAFAKAFPDRFVQVGVAEQNMAAVAAGMALAGKVPFISSYAAFSPGRNNEQIRTTIAINKANVKIAGAHAGISVGPDGATHQALEDIALMRVLPGMTVLVPCDSIEAQKATEAAAVLQGPVYLRFARAATPVLTTKETPFVVGKVEVFKEGKDVTIIACGPLVYEALLAAKKLEKEGVSVEVLNNHTVKPLDKEGILQSVKKTKAVVTVEEHQIAGGMGSSVVELLAQEFPVPVEMIGIKDRFGESGEPAELLEAFGLTSPALVQAIKKVIKRK
jgi:transketolase